MKFEQKIITPEMATKWLKKNGRNRSVKLSHAKNLAQQMSEGKWNSETAEAIKFNQSGDLIDGQHRLHAVIISGCSVKMLVAYDIPDEAFNVIDTGLNRNPSDVLHIAGIKNYALTSGIISLWAHYFYKDSYTMKVNNNEILELYNSDPEFWQKIVMIIHENYPSFKSLCSPSFMGGLFSQFYRLHPIKAKEFLEKFSTGIGIVSKKDPIRLLRERLIAERGNNAKLRTNHRVALFIKAWNFFIEGKEIGKLTFSESESYPIAK